MKNLSVFKRALALVLVFLMMGALFAGCGRTGGTASDTPDDSSSPVSQAPGGESIPNDDSQPGDSEPDSSQPQSTESTDGSQPESPDQPDVSGNTTTHTTSGRTTTAPTPGKTDPPVTTTKPTPTTTKPSDPSNGYHQPQFFISTFKGMPHSAGSTLADYVAIAKAHKEAGINLIENAIMSRDEGLLSARACEQVGVKFLIQNITSDRGYSGMGGNCPPISEDTIRFVVDEMKDYRWLEGYYTWDEVCKPDFGKCAQINNLFKKYDRSSLAFSIVLPSYGQYKWQTPDGNWEHSYYAQYVNEYVDKVDPDVVCFDYYPFQQHGGARTDLLNCAMWKDMGLMRKKSMETGKPFWFYFQAYNMGGSYTFTREMRSVQMYAGLAYGVKCLSYFTSSAVVCDGKGVKLDTFDEIKELNRKVQNLGDYLFKKDTEELYHFGIKKQNQVLFYLDNVAGSQVISGAPDGSIVGVFGDGTAKKYVLVVNKSYKEKMTGELTLRSAKKVSLYNHDTNKTTQVSASAAKVALNIPAGDCALYVIG